MMAPYVLPEDRSAVDTFNARLPRSSPCLINVDAVIPEPFIGTVTTAPVVVLQLNPGFNPAKDPASHADSQFRQSLFANLRHELQPWPFYFFDPRFRDSHPGGIWWRGKTKRLAVEISLERLALQLAVVEWFPYKSQRYRTGCRVGSQAYGFTLVDSAISRGALIVISRNVALWERSVPALRNYARKLTLSSVQNVALTPNNLMLEGNKTGAWNMLIESLR